VLVKDNGVRGAMLPAFEFLLAYSEKGVIKKSDLAISSFGVWCLGRHF